MQKTKGEILQGLDDSQQAVVQLYQGAVLVLATVGSGKTKVLAHRAAYASAEGYDPKRMLALTFTNKAANEMRERIVGLTGEAGIPIWISTFHSFCARLLQHEAKTLAISPSFTVYDEEDSKEVIRSILRETNSPWLGGNEREAQNQLSQLKRQLIYPSASPQFLSLNRQEQEVYRRYQEILETNDAMDYDDLIARTALLFKRGGPTLQMWQSRFDWIEVDEIQDTTEVEYDIVSLLARGHGNLALFGDEDQSIYAWRGANPDDVLRRFHAEFQNVQEKALSINYRSTKKILSAAKSLITASARARTKELDTVNEDGLPVALYVASDESDEARYVARSVERLVRVEGGYSFRQCAVLSRYNSQAVFVAQHLASAGLPHLTVEQFQFFQRMEVKDAVAYLRLIANPEDSVALKRVLQRPPRGTGPATISRLEERGPACGILLTDFVEQATYQSGDPCRNLLDTCLSGTYVCFDVETTGTDPATDEIIQIAGMKIEGGKTTSSFNRYARATKPVGVSEGIHGLSDEFLASNGHDIRQVLLEFIDFVGGSPLIGHNVSFDLDMLRAALGRCGITEPAWASYDTLQLSKRVLQLESYRLDAVAAHLGVAAPTHRAEVDAQSTTEVLQQLVSRIAKTAPARQELVAMHRDRFELLAKQVSRFRELTQTHLPADLLETILRESGYRDYLQRHDDQAARRLANLDELVEIIKRRQSSLPSDPREALREFVRYASLSRNVERLAEGGDAIAVLTIHQAKGLEFPVVFVVGAYDGSIPDFRNTAPDKLEEERHVFYVALTRAKERLHITYPLRRSNWSGQNRPSRFLQDIPDLLAS